MGEWVSYEEEEEEEEEEETEKTLGRGENSHLGRKVWTRDGKG